MLPPPKHISLQHWLKMVLVGFMDFVSLWKTESKIFESIFHYVSDTWFLMAGITRAGWAFLSMWPLNIASQGFFTGHFQGIQIPHIVACIQRKRSDRLGQKLPCFFWARLRRLVVSLLPLVNQSYGQPNWIPWGVAHCRPSLEMCLIELRIAESIEHSLCSR